jgi:hypothetical protein
MVMVDVPASLTPRIDRSAAVASAFREHRFHGFDRQAKSLGAGGHFAGSTATLAIGPVPAALAWPAIRIQPVAHTAMLGEVREWLGLEAVCTALQSLNSQPIPIIAPANGRARIPATSIALVRRMA